MDQEEVAACSGSRAELSAPQLGVREEQGQPGHVYTAPFLFWPSWIRKNCLHAPEDVLPLSLPTETSSSFECWQRQITALAAFGWSPPGESTDLAPPWAHQSCNQLCQIQTNPSCSRASASCYSRCFWVGCTATGDLGSLGRWDELCPQKSPPHSWWEPHSHSMPLAS